MEVGAAVLQPALRESVELFGTLEANTEKQVQKRELELGVSFRKKQARETQIRRVEQADSDVLLSMEVANKAEADRLFQQGIAFHRVSRYREAIESWQLALEIYRQLNERVGEAHSLGNLGTAYRNLGQYQQAINLLQQSLVIKREIGDRKGEANTLGSLGVAHNLLGQYSQAIELQQQALDIYREVGDRGGESASLGNLGNVYDRLGEYQEAIDFHQQSLDIAREIGDRLSEVNSIGNIGNLYNRLGEYQKAINSYQDALTISKEIGDLRGEANALGNLGIVYKRIDRPQEAIGFFQQQLAIADEIGDAQNAANALGNLGSAYFSLGQYQNAISFQQQYLELSKEIGDRLGEAVSLSSLGEIHLALEQFSTAQDFLLKSVEIFENIRSSELPDQNRISLFETQLSVYRNLERTLVLQEFFETALEISERGRARSFVQLLSENLSSASEGLSIQGSPSFSEIQRIAREQQSTLVEYSITKSSSTEGLSIYAWVVNPKGELHFKEVPVDDSLGNLSELVENSRRAIGINSRGGLESAISTSDENDATAQLNELYRMLIEPIVEWLPGDPEQRVVFIAQGELFLVPFPALQNEEGKYLIEKHTILTAPSIQALDLTHRQAATNRAPTIELLAIGNPTMPEVLDPEKGTLVQLPSLFGAEQEARAVAAFFNTEALIGAQATEQAVKERISSARIVHFATHGLLEYGTSEESRVRNVPGAIALTPSQNEDGLLTATEIIEELNLQADLVVLSACDTGLGRVTGDGVIGLSRSLIAAGASSVIVSLWSIPDAPTAELMVEFYSQRQQGKDKAQALRQAMLITMKTHPNPRDWAAFTLIGEAD